VRANGTGRAAAEATIRATAREGSAGAEVGIRLCEAGSTGYPIGSCPLGGNQYGAYKTINSPAAGVTWEVRMMDSDVRLWWDDEQPVNIPDVRTIAWTVPAVGQSQTFEVCVTNIEILGML